MIGRNGMDEKVLDENWAHVPSLNANPRRTHPKFHYLWPDKIFATETIIGILVNCTFQYAYLDEDSSSYPLQNTRVEMCQFTRIPVTRLNVSFLLQNVRCPMFFLYSLIQFANTICNEHYWINFNEWKLMNIDSRMNQYSSLNKIKIHSLMNELMNEFIH